MPELAKLLGKMRYSRLDTVAAIFATLLSFACLARGAVYDSFIAVYLMLLLPLVFIAFSATRAVHPLLKKAGILFLFCFIAVLCLQQWITPTGNTEQLWQQLGRVTGEKSLYVISHDIPALVRGIGITMLLVCIFCIALCIGTSESSTRVFFNSLLISGIAFVALTFFIVTSGGAFSNASRVYAHGFINANNAANYLGVMVLLTLTQAARFFRYPSRMSLERILPDIIDKLNIVDVGKGLFLLFSMLLLLAGLLMTGSRGGVACTVIGSVFFCFLVLCKMNLRSRSRIMVIILSGCILFGLLVWSMLNFGNVFLKTLEIEGVSGNTRLEIYSGIFPMIRDHLWLGVGLGSFPAAFMQYRPHSIFAEGMIDKAHNSYLEFAAEMGLPLFVILMGILLMMGYLLYGGVAKRKERYLTPIFGLSVLLLSGLHSLIDFPLQIPSIAALCIAIVTICASQTDPRFAQPADTSKSVTVKRIRIRKKGSSTKK